MMEKTPSSKKLPPGKLLRLALQNENPLQIVGTINAYTAILAKDAGFNAIYLSGAGVANASFGIPDLAITTMNDVLEDARRITSVTDLPLLVDIDTGWGSAFNIARTIKEMISAGIAAVHIEDQAAFKRCGHRPNKSLVSQAEMIDRIKAALDARTEPDFVIMARTDAYSVEGLESSIERAQAYQAAGADMLFAESMGSLSDYKAFCSAVTIPVLANMTEFGKTPLFTVDELRAVGVRMVLYPLTAFRMMSYAALQAYQTLRSEGTQKKLLPQMQTREDLYRCLDYYRYEKKLDELFHEEGK